MRHILRRLALVTVLSGLVAAAVGQTPVLAASDPMLVSPAVTSELEASAGAVPAMLAAAQRDLHLSRTEVIQRFGREQAAHHIADRLRGRLGAAYAGHWLTESSDQLVVAITEAWLAPAVRRAGAKPRLVRHSLADLNGHLDRLKRTPAVSASTDGAHTWYVDIRNNRVVVEGWSDRAATEAFVRASGVDPAFVTILMGSRAPVSTRALNAGDAIDVGAEKCSAGFAIQQTFNLSVTGFLTAGHCGGVGNRVKVSRFDVGVLVGDGFPNQNRDDAWVQFRNPADARNPVNTYGSGLLPVVGQQDPTLGQFLCLSGFQGRWNCGVVRDLGMSFELTDTTNGVRRLGRADNQVRTTACAAGGDSGGPWLAGNLAVGTQSGVQLFSGNQAPTRCPDTNVRSSTFQPIRDTLTAFSLQLIFPPSTNPALQITNAECRRDGASGPTSPPGAISCYADWIGGQDPAVGTWTISPQPRDFTMNSFAFARLTTAVFNCEPFSNENYFLTVTVTDAQGATDSRDVEAACFSPHDPPG